MSRIAIVGGGLFGRIIALHLNELGHRVKVIDALLPGSGLSAAGCLMKPSWTGKTPRRDECLFMLGRLIGVRDVPFQLFYKHLTLEDCWVLDKVRLMNHELFGTEIDWLWGKATSISKEFVRLEDGEEWSADQVIDCRGAWSRHSSARWGVSFESYGTTEAAIKPWRPYTQLVRFNLTSQRIWAGDGTALKHLDDAQIDKCRKRVRDFVGGEPPYREIRGQRPYPRKKLTTPCDLFTGDNGEIVVAGGGKNGTIAAAWAALMLGEQL